MEEKASPMQIMLEVPDDIVQALGQRPEALTRAALEMLAIEGYRSGRLSEGQVRRLLGYGTRYQVHGFLKAHGVDADYSEESLNSDVEFVDRFSEWLSSQTPRR